MPFEIPAAPTVVYDAEGLRVTAFAVDHRPVRPAVGYRFDYKGRSVVISGDTAASRSLEAAAKNAELLIHEELQPKMVKTRSDERRDGQECVRRGRSRWWRCNEKKKK